MSDTHDDPRTDAARRRFITRASLALAALPIVLVDGTRTARAGELPQLAEDDAQASALGYVHDTGEVDAGRYPNHSPEQKCLNCQLIQATEGEWRPCAIFPGKAVNQNGWCSAWVKKAG